jgi:hypothetical protein
MADRHLAAGEQRIAEQLALIQKMIREGYDTALARDLLRLLEETMVTWQDHRQLILDAIAQHEQALTPSPRTDPGPERPDLPKLLRRVRLERVQFGPDLCQSSSVLPNLFPDLLIGPAKPCCLCHSHLGMPD